MTRFLNISTDNTLGGLSPSDEFVASQKAIKEYVDNNSSNVQVDNLTITTNASDEIQTVAAINQNSGVLKFWKGTKAQYDALNSHDSDTQYTVIGDNTAGMMPTGSIIPFAGTTIPAGYLLCDGSAISRTTYADLFAAIGTVYGAGDGNTTFNVPNLINKLPMYTGIGIGNSSDGSLPNIWGSLDFGDRAPLNGWTPTNAFAYNGNIKEKVYYSNDNYQTNKNSGVNFYASRCGTCYGRYNEDRVYPSHLCMRFIIKH